LTREAIEDVTRRYDALCTESTKIRGAVLTCDA